MHTLDGRVGKLDRSHVFRDGSGEICPASLLRAMNNRRIGKFAGATLKLGPEHSHDLRHECHFLEKMSNPQKDLLRRFREASRRFRNERRKKRDM